MQRRTRRDGCESPANLLCEAFVTDIILASSSRYRSELLQKLRLPFRTRSPEVDETRGAGEPPRELVERLAAAKADAVADGLTAGLVIGSDQVAVCDEQVLGKPGTATRARAQLRLLSGRQVQFLTGLCVLDAGNRRRHVTVAETRVRFRTLSDAEIGYYVDQEQPYDCAGAFKSEGLGIALFDAIEGDDPNALVGLPLIALCRLLREFGVNVLSPSVD